MKRFRSCFAILAMLMIGAMVALFAFSVFFQQSQASASNATATLVAAFTPTRTAAPPVQPATTQPPAAQAVPDDTVTIQTDDNVIVITDAPAPTSAPVTIAATYPAGTPVATGTPLITPRHSGTSSYPLTVTAQVRMAQTNVANRQASIYATYTAIAIESESIYATLTAAAPTKKPKGK